MKLDKNLNGWIIFSFIGKNTEGKRTIGFRLSSYAAGSTAVGPIDDLIHIPELMKSAVKVLFKNNFYNFLFVISFCLIRIFPLIETPFSFQWNFSP